HMEKLKDHAPVSATCYNANMTLSLSVSLALSLSLPSAFSAGSFEFACKCSNPPRTPPHPLGGPAGAGLKMGSCRHGLEREPLTGADGRRRRFVVIGVEG